MLYRKLLYLFSYCHRDGASVRVEANVSYSNNQLALKCTVVWSLNEEYKN